MADDALVREALEAFGIKGVGMNAPHPAITLTPGSVGSRQRKAPTDDDLAARAYVLLAGRPLPEGNILVMPHLDVCYECRWCTFSTTGRAIYQVARPDGARGPWYEVYPTCTDCLRLWERHRRTGDEAAMIRDLDEYLRSWREAVPGLPERANHHDTMTKIIEMSPEDLAAKRERSMRWRASVYRRLRELHAQTLGEMLVAATAQGNPAPPTTPRSPRARVDDVLADINGLLG